MKSLIAEPRQNIDKNATRNIWKEKKEGQKKKGKKKIKKIKNLVVELL